MSLILGLGSFLWPGCGNSGSSTQDAKVSSESTSTTPSASTTSVSTSSTSTSAPPSTALTPDTGAGPVVVFPGRGASCTGHSLVARRVAVSGVPEGDVLNFRELPDPSAPIIATAVNGVEFAALGETHLASDGARWELVEIPLLPGQVVEEEAMNGCGWVNTRFVSGDPPATTWTADGTMVPSPVALTANMIIEAARAGDYERLDSLASAPGFTYDFGEAGGDPGGYWRSNPGSLSTLVSILTERPVYDGLSGSGTWIWPGSWVYASEEDDAAYGPRLGIAADGTWEWFVLGGD